jgi:hypothetical protein
MCLFLHMFYKLVCLVATEAEARARCIAAAAQNKPRAFSTSLSYARSAYLAIHHRARRYSSSQRATPQQRVPHDTFNLNYPPCATEIHALVSCMGKQQFVSGLDAAPTRGKRELHEMTPSQKSGAARRQID